MPEAPAAQKAPANEPGKELEEGPPGTMIALPPELFNRITSVLMTQTTPQVSFQILKDIETQVQAIKL